MDEYFIRLADAMGVWIESWQQLNPKESPEQSDSPAVPTTAPAVANGPAQEAVPHSNGAAKA